MNRGIDSLEETFPEVLKQNASEMFFNIFLLHRTGKRVGLLSNPYIRSPHVGPMGASAGEIMHQLAIFFLQNVTNICPRVWNPLLG